MNHTPFLHSLCFFGLAGTALFAQDIAGPTVYMICFAAVATVGVSHGALDYLKGRAVLETLDGGSIRSFYAAYILFALGTLLCWYVAPAMLLALFLTLASFHFGKEDSEFADHDGLDYAWILYLAKGSIVVSAPLYFSGPETNQIFQALGISVVEWVTPQVALVGVCAAAVANLSIGRRASTVFRVTLVIDFASVVLLNYSLPPLVAFSAYFCGLHSVRHSLQMAEGLDSNLSVGIWKFARQAWPLTAVTTLLFGGCLFLAAGHFTMNDSIYKVTFLGLAALTFPHICLEHLFERRVVTNP